MPAYNYEYYLTWADQSIATNVTLPIGGVFLLNSALSSMNSLWQWSHEDGTSLTPAEWDTLSATLANLIEAILTEVSDPMSVPIGAVVAFPFNPIGAFDDWLPCNGNEYLRVTYPDLYDALPAIYIINENGFEMPDLRSHFVLGAEDSGEVGDRGGEEDVTLAIAEMPSHNHPFTRQAASSPGGAFTLVTTTVPAHRWASGTEDAGGGQAHNNLPPYEKLMYWMRAK